MPLNNQRTAFADYYIDATSEQTFGNATQSAIKAKYSAKTAYSQGQRLLKNVEIITYINAKVAKTKAESIANREKRQQFWTDVMENTVNMADRLRASELLGRSEADFTDNIADKRVQEPAQLTPDEVKELKRLAGIATLKLRRA